MKKAFLVLLTIAALAPLMGCAVKSELDRPNENYPRNYPVY